MKQTKWIFSVGIVLLILGCVGSSNEEYGNQGAGMTRSLGGRYTITLATYRQVKKAEQAQQLQQRAKKLLGNDDVWIEEFQGALLVNTGHYGTENQAKRDLEHIRKIYRTLEAGLYQFFYVNTIPQPDLEAPATWDIQNSQCEFSLEVGIYYNASNAGYYDRKQDAIRAVKQLRETGETAYFVHGNIESGVFVGCFLENDIAEFQRLKKKYPYHYENESMVNDIQ